MNTTPMSELCRLNDCFGTDGVSGRLRQKWVLWIKATLPATSNGSSASLRDNFLLTARTYKTSSPCHAKIVARQRRLTSPSHPDWRQKGIGHETLCFVRSPYRGDGSVWSE